MIKQRVTGVYHEIARTIASALDGLPADETFISTKMLKRHPSLVAVPRNTFQRARQFVFNYTSAWIEDGRGYMRTPTFPAESTST